MRSLLTSSVILYIIFSITLCDTSFAAQEVPVNEETVREFADAAMGYGRISKDDPLSPEEADTIKSNAAKAAANGTRSLGDRKFFDQKASHFIRADREIQNAAERVGHLDECPVCVSMMRNVLYETGIDITEASLEFSAVVLASPLGERIEFHVERNGNVHRVDPVSGETYPIPAGQLLRELGEWYVTDGWQLEGPVERTKNPKAAP